MGALDNFVAKIQFGTTARNNFYEQIISLMRSKLSRREAIKKVHWLESKEGKKPTNGASVALQSIITSLENGDSFGDAMSKWAPRSEVMVLRAIEDSRNFPDSLERYLEMEKKRLEMKGIARKGAAMPLLQLTLIMGLSAFIGKSILPILADIYPMDKWTGMGSGLAGLAYFANNLVIPLAIILIIVATCIRLSLPRWSKYGRVFADRLPFYSMYRTMSGIDFLVSLTALLSGSIRTNDAIERLMPGANPYVRHRLKLILRRLTDGEKIGSALNSAKTGFPHPDMINRIRILEETQDINNIMSKLADEYIDQTMKKVKASVAAMGAMSMMILLLVTAIISLGIVDLSTQMSAGIK